MNEMELKAQMRKDLGRIPNAKFFNNPVGNFYAGKPRLNATSQREGSITLDHARRVQCGLITGACDLIGWKTVEITPDMVGQKIAQFVGIELKTDKGYVKAAQGIFIGNVRDAGGIAGVARSTQEALALLGLA